MEESLISMKYPRERNIFTISYNSVGNNKKKDYVNYIHIFPGKDIFLHQNMHTLSLEFFKHNIRATLITREYKIRRFVL